MVPWGQVPWSCLEVAALPGQHTPGASVAAAAHRALSSWLPTGPVNASGSLQGRRGGLSTADEKDGMLASLKREKMIWKCLEGRDIIIPVICIFKKLGSLENRARICHFFPFPAISPTIVQGSLSQLTLLPDGPPSTAAGS